MEEKQNEPNKNTNKNINDTEIDVSNLEMYLKENNNKINMVYF